MHGSNKIWLANVTNLTNALIIHIKKHIKIRRDVYIVCVLKKIIFLFFYIFLTKNIIQLIKTSIKIEKRFLRNTIFEELNA